MTDAERIAQLEAEREALQGRLRALEWQPMETAPPATNLWVYEPGCGCYTARYQLLATGTFAWVGASAEYFNGQPTCWMPLPPLPTVEAVGAIPAPQP